MRCFATLPPIDLPSATAAIEPIVFVEDQPEPALALREIRTSGPLTLTQCRLQATDSDTAEKYVGRRAHLAVPRALSDGSSRWELLAVGRLADPTTTIREGREIRLLELREAWSDRLLRPADLVLQQDSSGVPQTVGAGRLGVGAAANRSPATFDVGGQAVHLLQPGGEPWNLAQALATINAFYRLELNLQTLPSTLGEQPLDRNVPLDDRLGQTLAQLLQEHGLIVRRRWHRQAAQLVDRRSVQPHEHGRRIAWPADPRGRVLRWDRSHTSPLARPWIVRGQRPVVESTFELRPGWDPALADQPDDTYDASLSPDFSRYANVFRRWVLNEDGALDDEPRFDLDALFDQTGLPLRPIPLGDNLTLDDAGQPLAPVAQISLDNGQTWSRLTADWRLLDGRAGLKFTGDRLADHVLAAARAQTLRVRITATLTSPEPRTARRWQGNPFAAVGPAVVLDRAESFRFQKLMPGSLHHADVTAGRLQARQHDDTLAMDLYLIGRLQRSAKTDTAQDNPVSLKLSGSRPELRVGDRVEDLERALPRPAGQPRVTPTRSATVTDVRCRFGPDPSTRLVLQP